MDSLENLNINSHNLPPEILDVIFDIISDEAGRESIEFNLNAVPTSNNHHAKEICPLSLVCRTWNHSANRVLYRNLTITKVGQLPSLVANSVRLLPLINHVSILWNRQPWILPQDPELALIPDLLNLSPSLSQITLAGEQFDLSSQHLLEALANRSNSSFYTPIRSLCCCSLQMPYIDQRFGPQGRRTSAVLNNILAACGSNLVEARFDEFRSSFISSVPQDCVAFVPSIRKIVLEKVVVEAGYLGGLLSQLSQGNLRELSLIRTTLGSISVWREIINVIGKKLEVLEMNECDFWSIWEPESDEAKVTVVDSILDSCPRLSTLTLIGALDSEQPLFETFLPNLEVLTLGTRTIKPEVIQAGLHLGYWPKLTQLTVLRDCGWSMEATREVFEIVETMGSHIEKI